MLSPDQVRKAFQRAIPNRQRAFEAAVADARAKKDHRSDMKTWYPREVTRLAKDEAMLRLGIARDKVQALIDSGWTPNPMETIRSVFSNMSSMPDGMDKNPYLDLENAIKSGVLDVAGLWPSDQRREKKADPLVKEFGQCWFDTSEEFIGELECYIPKRESAVATNINIQGDAHYVQTGGTANVTQNIGIDARELVNALAVFQQAVRESGDRNAAEINVAVQAVVSEASTKNPNAGKIAGLLNNLSQLVQSSSALPGAWNTLASAASMFTGHPFPRFPTS